MSRGLQQRAVTVIGGGIVGLCSALSLQERGFQVSVVDAAEATPPPSWGNAGRIAVEVTEPLASFATLRAVPALLFCRGGPAAFPLSGLGSSVPFAARFLAASLPKRFARGKTALRALLATALPAWRRRVAALDTNAHLVEAGHYSIWENPSLYQRSAAVVRRDSGAATAVDASPADIARLQTLIRIPIAGAMKFYGTASIADPADLLAALRASLVRRGGGLRTGTCDLAQATREDRPVVVAAGIGSGPLLRAIGHAVPMIAERGYHLQQAGPDWPSDMPPLFFEDRDVVVTRFRSALRATSFVEFSRQGAPPDKRKWARLRQHMDELGLPFRQEATEWMGSRPTLPDYLPAIGRSRRQPHVYYAFGHQHLGLTLAATTGEALAALVNGEVPAVDLGAFDLERFA